MGETPKAAANSTSTEPVGVPLIDMGRQYRDIEENILAAIRQVCASGRFILGPDCLALEEALAKNCQVEHAISCASGSDAILLALMAYQIGPGDEVIVPSFTFFATASAVARLGAKPVFVDIEPASFNLDPTAVAAALTPATKAIIPVHLFGQCADIAALGAIGAGRGLPVIEDAAQALGADMQGRPAGSLADVGCFSFYPTKNLGGFGDGGLLTTHSAELAQRLRLLRGHGMQPRYHHQLLGINSRLDSLQAAVLNVKLPHLGRWTVLRRGHAANYGRLFAAAGLDTVLGLPSELAGRRHVWNQYTIRVADGLRDALREHLTERRIGTEIYYPIPLHQQPCFSYLGYPPGSLPETERAALEVLALPIFPEMTAAEQELVVGEIACFFRDRVDAEHTSVAKPKFMEQKLDVGRNAQRRTS